MIRIGQFSTPDNSAIVLSAKIALHLRNQKSESLLVLQKRFCSSSCSDRRIVFVESLILLYALSKISFDSATDRIVFNENT